MSIDYILVLVPLSLQKFINDLLGKFDRIKNIKKLTIIYFAKFYYSIY